ncbi:CorA family divalent cation transporter [Phytohabitans houttuyneae]|uniref:Uncharacterized protein n=1 Tax=Phytohabitans houttuyneae TaxID=1076126 RepID=A0A6V8KIK4_9ACTN|nr:hypothetical protein Phou_061290 [Phytohabitans houttuyneae]
MWVDTPSCDPTAAKVLSDVFGFHPMAVADCGERNRVPKVHAYTDHVFVVLHAPERGDRGHVHYLELDQFVGQNYAVTAHGPLNTAVAPQAALGDRRGAGPDPVGAAAPAHPLRPLARDRLRADPQPRGVHRGSHHRRVAAGAARHRRQRRSPPEATSVKTASIFAAGSSRSRSCAASPASGPTSWATSGST